MSCAGQQCAFSTSSLKITELARVSSHAKLIAYSWNVRALLLSVKHTLTVS